MYIVNEGKVAKFIGGKLLQPGEGREFFGLDVPPEHQAEQVVVVVADPDMRERLLEVLKGSIPSILPGIAQASDEELSLAEQLEREGAARKGLLEAIGAERVRRSDEALQAKQQAQREQALADAQAAVQAAQAALAALPAGAPEADVAAAQSALAEAQARADALAAGAGVGA